MPRKHLKSMEKIFSHFVKTKTMYDCLIVSLNNKKTLDESMLILLNVFCFSSDFLLARYCLCFPFELWELTVWDKIWDEV